MLPLSLYNYKATILRIIDGDTIEVAIAVGFHITFRTRVRLLSINTPEIRGESREAGLISKHFVEEELPVGTEVHLHTEKDDAFGRWLAILWYIDRNGEVVSLNVKLLDLGLAVPY